MIDDSGPRLGDRGGKYRRKLRDTEIVAIAMTHFGIFERFSPSFSESRKETAICRAIYTVTELLSGLEFRVGSCFRTSSFDEVRHASNGPRLRATAHVLESLLFRKCTCIVTRILPKTTRPEMPLRISQSLLFRAFCSFVRAFPGAFFKRYSP